MMAIGPNQRRDERASIISINDFCSEIEHFLQGRWFVDNQEESRLLTLLAKRGD
jgi:hypothetical protein